MRARRLAAGVGFAAVAAWVAVLASRSYFTTDDHVFFQQRQDMPFGLHFLTEPIYDHFSPWHRLQDAIVVGLTDQGWWLAVAIGMVWYVAAVVLFTLLVRRLVGAHPAGWVAIGAFALSPLLVELVQWWGLGAQTLPELVFILAALLAGLHGRRLLVVAFYALALCGFIKAVLLLPLLVLVLYARPGAGRPPWRADIWMWAGLIAVSIAYAVIVSDDRYYRYIADTPAAGLELWAKYLVAGVGEGVVPLTFAGTVDGELGAGNVLVLVAAAIALAAILALTLRRAVWTWAVAAVTVLVTLAMSGQARLGEFGVDFVALDPRYNFEAALALGLAAMMAARARWPKPIKGPGPLIGLAVLVLVLGIDSGLRRERQYDGAEHRAYFETFSRTLAADPSVDIIETLVPGYIVTPQIVPYNQLSRVLALREPDVRVGATSGPPATIDPDGTVHRVELTPGATLQARCAPTTYAVDLPPGDTAAVLTFTRANPAPAADVLVEADTGQPDGHVVAGTPLPRRFSFLLRMEEGQRDARLITSAGGLRTVTLTPYTGGELCLTDARVETFPLVG